MMINLHSSQHDYVTVRNVIASSLNKSMLTAKWFSFNGTSKKVLNFTDITNFPYKKQYRRSLAVRYNCVYFTNIS